LVVDNIINKIMFLKLKLSRKERRQLKKVEEELAIRMIVAAQEVLEEEKLAFVDDLDQEDYTDLQELVIVNAISNVIL
jgi:hypothetical protein